MALRTFFDVYPARKVQPADRIRDLLGSLDSGIPNLAEEHGVYVLKSLKNTR